MRRPSRQGLAPVCTSGDRDAACVHPHKDDFLTPDKPSLIKKSHNGKDFFSFLNAACLIISMIIVLSMTGDAEAQDLKDNITEFFDAVRRGSHPNIPTEFSGSDEQALELLQPFLSDSNERVALKAHEVVFYVSSLSATPTTRAAGICTLMSACNSARPVIRPTALELLRQFRKSEFPTQAKDSLRRFIRMETAPSEDLIKMAGFLDLHDLIPRIRPWSQPGNPTGRRWAALLSLARMGDAFAIRDVMQRVKKLPVNDDLVYKIFPDLVYTRHPEAIAYMVQVLSDDQHHCISADVEKERPIPCGYRVMEQLAGVIESFPLQLDEGGDLATDHYPEALKQSRDWFIANKTFTILSDRY